MKSTQRATHVFLCAAILPLVSCATMRKAGGDSVAMMKSATSATVSKLPDLSITRLLPGRGIKVVEVREKDLKELPSGQELARAYEKERKGGFWIFGGPVDFKEPSLPEPGSEMDGSLLPPVMP